MIDHLEEYAIVSTVKHSEHFRKKCINENNKLIKDNKTGKLNKTTD